MQSKIKLSLIAVIAVTAIAGISISMPIFEQSDNVEASETAIIKGSIPDYSLKELSQGANYAISGEVQRIVSTIVTRNNEEYVFSDVKIEVEEDLFGEYDEEYITVRIQGGQVGDATTISHIDASFEEGERVLVFVAGPEPESIWGDNYYVAGMLTGKYTNR